MTCLELHEWKENTRDKMDEINSESWSASPCNQHYGNPSLAASYNQTACDDQNNVRDDMNAYYSYYYGYGAFRAENPDRHDAC